MKESQNTVGTWMVQFGQSVPSELTIPDVETLKLRAALELEETLEKILHGFGLGIIVTDINGDEMAIVRSDLKRKNLFTFHQVYRPNMEQIRDGSADQKVVILGTDNACGIQAEPDFNEVMRSNFSKMWTDNEVDSYFGVFDVARTQTLIKITDGHGFYGERVSNSERCWLIKNAAGKVIKSDSYSPANLTPILTAQGQ